MMMSNNFVHPKTDNPTEAWEELKETQRVMRFKVKTPKEPPGPNKMRVVCVSDTHSLTSHLKRPVPPGDILIHAGDFTRCGHVSEVREFNAWLGTLPHPHKLVIAGNHELSFDPSFRSKHGLDFLPSPRCSHAGDFLTSVSMEKIHGIPNLGIARESLQEAVQAENIRAELTNCVYLEDSGVTVNGLNVYGTPWQPEYCGWAFNLPRGQACIARWDRIPDGTDILVTHTPPVGYGDLCCTGVRAGCVELLSTVQGRVRPKYHVYGHIHEGYGVRSDGRTVFVNASTCDINYMPNNKPIVFDIPFPPGFSR